MPAGWARVHQQKSALDVLADDFSRISGWLVKEAGVSWEASKNMRKQPALAVAVGDSQRLTSKDEARADGLRVEQDLFAFTADEIGILADFAGSWGIKVTSAYRDQQWVAELMSLIRLSVAKGQDGLLARHFSRPLRREYSGAG